MYLYFNAQGKLVEIINDTALRKGNDAVDKVFIHFEDADYTEDCYLMVQRADGTHTLEYLVEDTITKQIPYDAKRDLKYFKDYTPYKFYVYTLQNTDLSVEGLTKMTIRLVNGSSTLALGLVTFNVENSVVKDDNGILQSQYDYILQLIQNKIVDQDNTITVLPNIPSNLSDYDYRYILVKDNDDTFCELYYIDQGVAILQFHLSKAWADDLENRISQAEQDIDKIENGTTIVGKALRDSLGNVIKDSYVSAVYPVYNDTMDKLYIETYGVGDILLANNEVILPKATTTKNGLMSKEDKTKLDNIDTTIENMVDSKTIPLQEQVDDIEIEVGQLQTNKADLVGGKVPASQLPAYVDDVLEFDTFDDFPGVGQSDTVYIAKDTNKTYRWTGTSYVTIGNDLALGETSSTAYRGDRGKTAYDHSQIVSGNPHNTTKAMIGLGNVDNTSDLNKPISTATQNALNKKADKVILTNLISNGDFLIPSSNPNIPQGFSCLLATDTTLVNNIVKFTATGVYGRLQSVNLVYNDGDVIYRFARVKADSPLVALTNNYSNTRVYHSGNGQWQFLSVMQTDTQSVKVLSIRDERGSGWTPIEVDYVGAINLTAVFGAGNEPTKAQMDDLIKRIGFFQEEEINWLDFPNTQVYKEVTWSELINLRNSNSLIAGSKYRITDYITTTTQENTQSANHPFDIIVEALSANTLSENASAIQSARDTSGYFNGVDLSGWKLKYTLDNDNELYYWADAVNGKGVIYQMIDEWGNDLPYDFKNIQFKRYLIETYAINTDLENRYYALKDLGSNTVPSGATIDDNDFIWAYTFTVIDENGIVNDVSLNKNKTFVSDEGIYYHTQNNKIGSFNFDYYDEIEETIKTKEALGNNVILYDYDYYGYWEFYGFYSNTIGNDFHYNTIGNDFHSNTIGNGFYSNTIGNGFYSNTIGNGFYSNTIGNGFYYNTIGNYFYYNTIGNGFYSNTIGNFVRFIQFSGDEIRYLYIKSGLIGASSANRLDLYYSELQNRTYPTTIEQIANGNIVSIHQETPLFWAGKKKITNTSSTWEDI